MKPKDNLLEDRGQFYCLRRASNVSFIDINLLKSFTLLAVLFWVCGIAAPKMAFAQTSIETLEQACKSGDYESCNSAGVDFATGAGVEKDLVKAREFYQLSCEGEDMICLLYTSPSPRDRQKTRMPSSA